MTAEVIPIKANAGPPETNFEREAVETLIAAIRNFRADHGVDPSLAVTVLTARGDGSYSHRITWFNLNTQQRSLVEGFAMSGALLTQKALAVD